jgi:hypothetical protein
MATHLNLVSSFFNVIHTVRILTINTLTYALNKIHSEASIKLLHVSTPGCLHQGTIQNKGVQGQHTNHGILSPFLK